MYKCRLERYSQSPHGKKLASFVITAPRVVLAEMVTHRKNKETLGDDFSFSERTVPEDISKNSASSRAIPFLRMLENIEKDPYIPQFTMNQKGMQGQPADERLSRDGEQEWLAALKSAAKHAANLHKMGFHKQVCNRLLEPWGWVTQIVTSANWDNFFALRCHRDADPAFSRIARMMFLEMRKHQPDQVNYGQWHLPFVPKEEALSLTWTPPLRSTFTHAGVQKKPIEFPDLIKHSMARCAWVSYENADKKSSPEQMIDTFNRCTAGELVHASVTEHQGTPLHPSMLTTFPRLRSNLDGWLQARKLLLREAVTEYNPSEEEIASWGIL